MGSAGATIKEAQGGEAQGELIPQRGRKRLPDDEVCAATRKMRMLRSLACGNRYEKLARATGATLIAGVDEVGRGALFGPVVAAAVVLPPDTRIRGLRDSKQLLVEDRERLDVVVRERAIAIVIEEREPDGDGGSGGAARSAAGSPADRCAAAGSAACADEDYLWRLAEYFDCGGV